MTSRMGEPALGTERTVERFAWFPTRLSDGTWCHLSWYVVREVFTEPRDVHGWGSLTPDWHTDATWRARP